MTQPARALVIGEALVDEVVATDGTVAAHPGGSPANVALGLARLGREAHLLTHIGADRYGDLVSAHLRASGVTLVPGSADANATSVATATLGTDGAATYEFALEWALSDALTLPDSPTVVHTGSIAAVIEPGAAEVHAVLTRLRPTATITYDPNARPSLMGNPAQARASIERIVALADVVKVSDEDLEWIASPDDTIDSIAHGWLALGPALVVVTRGGSGASAWTAHGRTDIAAPAVTVADTVGAGDSFMAGLIDGLWAANLLGANRRDALRAIDSATLTSVLDRCARIAAITVSRPGANPPTAAELSD